MDASATPLSIQRGTDAAGRRGQFLTNPAACRAKLHADFSAILHTHLTHACRAVHALIIAGTTPAGDSTSVPQATTTVAFRDTAAAPSLAFPRFAPAFPSTTLGPVPAARMWGEAVFYMASPGKGAQPDHHPTQELRQEHGRVSGEAHPSWPTAVDFALMLALGGLVIAFVKSAAALVADSMFPMAAPSASTSDALGVFFLLVAVVATVALFKIGGC